VDFESLPLKERVRLLLPFAQSDPDVAAELERVNATLEQNPLLGFEPHAAQRDFILARTPVVAAFAGNRFGKSTALGVCALREALPAEALPELLRVSKRFDGPTQGWILVPTEDKIDDSFRPAFQKWCPPSEFSGGSWGKAFKGDTNLLRFRNGSTIQFKTYKQDPSTLGGAGLHYVGYDEPPPKKHREECMWRLGDHGGYEMFAMTPLDTNTGYVRREIYKKRESPGYHGRSGVGA
jgi:phage terminase large subunit-like protein